jgi:hypothetical protein
MDESLEELAARTARETIEGLADRKRLGSVGAMLAYAGPREERAAEETFDEAEHPRGRGGMFVSKSGKRVKVGDRVAIAHASSGFSSYLGHTGKVTHLLPDTQGGIVVNPDRGNMHPLQTLASHVNHTDRKGHDFSHADTDALERELDRITNREQSYAQNNPKYRVYLRDREDAIRAELHRRNEQEHADFVEQHLRDHGAALMDATLSALPGGTSGEVLNRHREVYGF